MVFSFECHNCSQPLEAELDLCGATFNCPSCGQVLVIPQIDSDPHLKNDQTTGEQKVTQSGISAVELESAKSEILALKAALGLAEERASALESDLRAQREAEGNRAKESETSAKKLRSELAALKLEFEKMAADKEALAKSASQELAQSKERLDELAKECEEAKARISQEGAKSKKPAAELAKLRVEIEALESAKADAQKMAAQELAKAEERAGQLERERDEAKARALKAEASAQDLPVEVQKLRGEIDTLKSANSVAQKIAAEELAKAKDRARELERERDEAKARTVQAEESVKEFPVEVEKLRGEILALKSTSIAVQKSAAEELAKAKESAGELERERDEAKARALEAEASTKRPSVELTKLQGDLKTLESAKTAAEAHAAEHVAQLNARIHQLERGFEDAKAQLVEVKAERGDALKRAEQSQAEAESHLKKLESLSAEWLVEERNFKEAQSQAEIRCLEFEKQRDAAVLKVELAEQQKARCMAGAGELLKKFVAARRGLKSETNPETEQVLNAMEQELKVFSTDLASSKSVSLPLGGVPSSNGDYWFASALQRREPILLVTLIVGLVLGVGVSRRVSPIQTIDPKTNFAEASATLRREDTVEKKSPEVIQDPSAAKISSEPMIPKAEATLTSSGSENQAAPGSAPVVPSPVTEPNPPPASTRRSLPDSFLGIKYGSFIRDLDNLEQWQETAGRWHRKAALLGAPVEVVLSPDEEGRVIMGSYVRIIGRQPEVVAQFLEWVVKCQDEVSALYGNPSAVHQVEGASEAAELVQKINTGEDYYEALWQRADEDTMINLSVRLFSERGIVFRLEYRSRQLAEAFAQRKEAGRETPPERTPEKTPEEAPK